MQLQRIDCWSGRRAPLELLHDAHANTDLTTVRWLPTINNQIPCVGPKGKTRNNADAETDRRTRGEEVIRGRARGGRTTHRSAEGDVHHAKTGPDMRTSLLALRAHQPRAEGHDRIHAAPERTGQRMEIRLDAGVPCLKPTFRRWQALEESAHYGSLR